MYQRPNPIVLRKYRIILQNNNKEINIPNPLPLRILPTSDKPIAHIDNPLILNLNRAINLHQSTAGPEHHGIVNRLILRVQQCELALLCHPLCTLLMEIGRKIVSSVTMLGPCGTGCFSLSRSSLLISSTCTAIRPLPRWRRTGRGTVSGLLTNVWGPRMIWSIPLAIQSWFRQSSTREQQRTYRSPRNSRQSPASCESQPKEPLNPRSSKTASMRSQSSKPGGHRN